MTLQKSTDGESMFCQYQYAFHQHRASSRARHRELTLSQACFGGMLFGIETGTIGGVLTLPAFIKKYGLSGLSKVETANLSANIVSTLQAGCFVGALASYYFADKFGRRPSLLIAAVISIIGTIMQAGANGMLPVLYVGR
jgi:MFS family permease